MLNRHLLTAILLIAAIDIAGIYALQRSGTFVRFDPASRAEFRELSEPLIPGDVEFYRSEIEAVPAEPGPTLQWVMNQVGGVSDTPSGVSSPEALRLARGGEGLWCGPMARMFRDAARAQGLRALTVQLWSSVLAPQHHHVTTEVWVDGRWIIYDPSFHTSFEMDGRLLGVADIHASLYDGTYSQIEPRFHGEVRYPARLDDYYVNWLPLYSHAFIMENASPPLWARIPPLRYWFGPRQRYLTEAGGSSLHAAAVSDFYLLFVVILPSVLLALGTIFIGSAARAAWVGRSARKENQAGAGRP